jgi:hypothetical protein
MYTSVWIFDFKNVQLWTTHDPFSVNTDDKASVGPTSPHTPPGLKAWLVLLNNTKSTY